MRNWFLIWIMSKYAKTVLREGADNGQAIQMSMNVGNTSIDLQARSEEQVRKVRSVEDAPRPQPSSQLNGFAARPGGSRPGARPH